MLFLLAGNEEVKEEVKEGRLDVKHGITGGLRGDILAKSLSLDFPCLRSTDDVPFVALGSKEEIGSIWY